MNQETQTQIRGKLSQIPFLQLPPTEQSGSEQQAIAPTPAELTPETIDQVIARLQSYRAQMDGKPAGIKIPGAIANMDKVQLATAIAFVGLPTLGILAGLVILSFPTPQAASTIAQQQEIIRQQQKTIERLGQTQECKVLCF